MPSPQQNAPTTSVTGEMGRQYGKCSRIVPRRASALARVSFAAALLPRGRRCRAFGTILPALVYALRSTPLHDEGPSISDCPVWMENDAGFPSRGGCLKFAKSLAELGRSAQMLVFARGGWERRGSLPVSLSWLSRELGMVRTEEGWY